MTHQPGVYVPLRALFLVAFANKKAVSPDDIVNMPHLRKACYCQN